MPRLLTRPVRARASGRVVPLRGLFVLQDSTTNDKKRQQMNINQMTHGYNLMIDVAIIGCAMAYGTLAVHSQKNRGMVPVF